MTKDDILNELFMRQEISMSQYLLLMNANSMEELKRMYNLLIDNLN